MQLSDDNYAILTDLYRRGETDTLPTEWPDHMECVDTCVYGGREATYCFTAR